MTVGRTHYKENKYDCCTGQCVLKAKGKTVRERLTSGKGRIKNDKVCHKNKGKKKT